MVRFLGRNGEPYSGYTAVINLTSKFTSQIVNSELKTDINGEIHLGHLTNFSNLSVRFKHYPGTGTCRDKTYQINEDARISSVL